MFRALGFVAVAVVAFVAGVSVSQADTFTYGYNTVYDSNANQYLVSEQNVTTNNEGGSPPITYYYPSGIGVLGSLTYEFTFANPTTEVNLLSSLFSLNSVSWGQSSLWASTDGSNWELLLNNPLNPGGNMKDCRRRAIRDWDLPASPKARRLRFY